MRSTEASEALFDRAQEVLAGGVSTIFRAQERPVPLFFREAVGSRLVDADGNSYIDFVCGFGPIILGHANPRVLGAVSAVDVQQVGGQHEGEIELAERLCELVPAFELVRFSSTGSEAIHAALRLARACTGRSLVVKCVGHYHGWFDDVQLAVSSSSTWPETAGQVTSARSNVIAVDWNDLEALKGVLSRMGDRVAAVIMEPIPCNMGVILPRSGYLEAVRTLTCEHGCLLVFDEVITGFRVGLGGAQGLVGVTPDIAVVAKAMGNGFPISAFGGRREIMGEIASQRVLHAGTYNGGGVSVAASLATLDVLVNDRDLYERMRVLGARLQEGLTSLAREYGHGFVTQGPGPVFFAWFTPAEEIATFSDHMAADHDQYARFAELLLAEGVRVIPSGRWYLNASHEDSDVDRALEAAQQAFARLGT